MYSKITTAIQHGMDAVPVCVEADISDGMPGFEMVGYLSSEVKEARERVKTALKNSGFRIPAKHITVNLTPADIRKSGSRFDFPVAAAILSAFGYIKPRATERFVLIGEVGLDGRILPVRGALCAAVMAREKGFEGIVVPAGCAAEAGILPKLKVVALNSLSEFVTLCREDFKSCAAVTKRPCQAPASYGADFSQIRGQPLLRRACEIAAAGMHNMLIIGPPGSGKTMAAQRIPTILPELTPDEKLKLAEIYSLCGLIDDKHLIRSERPFRNPHHSITPQAMAGGGRFPMPGEISLAHRGVLFLDELPEFKRASLEILREPMEEKKIRLSRIEGSVTYPADFMLVASMNPCPCGFYPDLSRCSCTPHSVWKYINRVSQAFLNRIDICTETSAASFCEIKSFCPGESSDAIRSRIAAAHALQRQRFEGSGILFNGDMRAEDINKFCQTDQAGAAVIERMYGDERISARSLNKLLAAARTIADLDGSGAILSRHIEEAMLYRLPDRKYWRRY